MTTAPALPLLLVTTVAIAAMPAFADPQQMLRREALQTEIALAESKEIYLVLDPEASEVRLEIQNVVLRRFPAEIRVGVPRGSIDGAPVWPTVVFTLDDEVPERPRETIRPPDKSAADSTAAAPTSENLLQQRERMLSALPGNYTLHFSPDLDLVIASEGEQAGSWSRLEERLARAWARLGGAILPMRVLLHMTVADAKRLSVALHTGMSLLVLPPAVDDAADAD